MSDAHMPCAFSLAVYRNRWLEGNQAAPAWPPKAAEERAGSIGAMGKQADFHRIVRVATGSQILETHRAHR